MMLHLTPAERRTLDGAGGPAAALAMRVVAAAAELLGADRLVEITSAHVDGCLYHGDSGVEFAERLVAGGGRLKVPCLQIREADGQERWLYDSKDIVSYLEGRFIGA